MRIVGLLAGLIVIIGSVVYFLSEGQFGSQQSDKEVDHTYYSDCLSSAPDCLLHISSNLELNIRIEPLEIVPLERFRIHLSSPIESSLDDISDLIVWVKGRDMDMGKHILTQASQGNDLTQGVSLTGMIPVCTVDDDMVWRLVVSFMHKGKLVHVNLDLKTTRHGV